MSTNVIDPRRQEADELRDVIKKQGAYDESLYDKLMQAKESGALDVMHRVLDDEKEARERDERTRSLVHRPLHVIIIDSVRILREVITDLAEARTIAQVSAALTSDGRPAYLGVLLLLAAALLLIFT